MQRRLGLEPSAAGVSEVSMSFTRHEHHNVALLLGNAANSAAAVDDAIPGYSVTHIICVASGRNARSLEGRARAAQKQVAFRAFPMSDWMSPDDEVNIAVDLAAPLAALRQAVAECGTRFAGTGPKRAVLVHCDMGHNRSPTLVLSFLIGSGMSLRKAYQQLLRARPGVDPLPPYRQGLQMYAMHLAQARGEDAWSEGRAVHPEEPFATHISQLLRIVRSRESTGGPTCARSVPVTSLREDDSSGNESGGSIDSTVAYLDMAYALREESICSLLAEVLD